MKHHELRLAGMGFCGQCCDLIIWKAHWLDYNPESMNSACFSDKDDGTEKLDDCKPISSSIGFRGILNERFSIGIGLLSIKLRRSS